MAAPDSAPMPSLNQVSALVGARAAGADSALRARGFFDKGSDKQGERAFSMWCNGGGTRQCQNMVVREGRVERLESTIENNCL